MGRIGEIVTVSNRIGARMLPMRADIEETPIPIFLQNGKNEKETRMWWVFKI